MISFDMSEVRDLADDLDDAGPRVTQRSRLVMEKTSEDVVADAQHACPVRTGNLKGSIGADVDGDGLGFEAGPTASYGADVEFGTPAHIIRPRDKQALFWPGAGHPVRMVQHPGTSPQPYLLPAFDRRVPPAIQALERVAAEPW